ncbi:MAG TPA: isochorismatase family protein [Actinopolymorphaceae bacterium]|jgi:nicotinamidase-related amidase
MTRVWDAYLTEQDKAHLAVNGERPPFGFGESPVVLSIDNYRAVVGDEPQPLVESIKTWPSSTGLAGWKALAEIEKLFAQARKVGIPIVHITGLSPSESGVASWGRGRGVPGPKDAAALDREARRFDIVEQAAPLPGEAVLRKTAPSAFFGTPLMAHLNAIGADTLIVCGESTSGCVRASVVDGRSYRFRVVVVEECVYDRHEACHAINLFDMNQKYADVLPLADVLAWMDKYAAAKQSAAA